MQTNTLGGGLSDASNSLHQAGANSLLQGRAGSQAIQPQAPLTVEIGERIGRLLEIIQGTGSNVRDLRTRLLGSWPENMAGSTTNAAKSDGIAADLLDRLDGIIAVALEVQAHSNVLNNRI